MNEFDPVEWLMKQIPPKAAYVIDRRFGLWGDRESYDKIARALNVSRERIRQIEFKTIQQLRQRAVTVGKLKGSPLNSWYNRSGIEIRVLLRRAT